MLDMNDKKGFTLVELIVGIAVIGIITAVALPSLNTFLVKMRVENEISQIHRLALIARNSAINMEQNVTLCPLNASNTCNNNWQGELSVFIDLDNDGVYESASNETLIKVKAAIASNDVLTYTGFSRITYSPTGLLASASNSTFRYCPDQYSDLSRGVVVSSTGRLYKTTDTDNDGKDETRAGTEISCN